MPDERPPTVKELSDQGREYQWNAQIPLKYWTRALDAIYHEVRTPARAQQRRAGDTNSCRAKLITRRETSRWPLCS